MHKFEFVDLGDLFNLASTYVPKVNPEYATDIIGVVERFERLRPVDTKFGEKNIVKFKICDARNSHYVTAWSRMAETTDTLYQDDLQKPVIVILASVKLQTFNKSVQISILPSTKVYFNLEDNVVNEFRKRLNREGYVSNDTVVPTNSVSDSVHVIETVTLKELVEKTSTKYSKMNFMCSVKIKKVQTGDTWWYDCCPKCHEELNEFEGMFKCPNCKLTIPVTEKRYRIMIIAEDSTGVANVNLSDRAVKRLVGKSATNMVDELGEGVTKSSIPQLIMDVAEKDVTLNIDISDDNVLINSTLYNATDAYPSKNSKPSSSESVQKIEDNTLSSCGDVSYFFFENFTPYL
ncbi:hypothetical protein POM88_046488 [Heracleum sosnowskyi]|uniref:Replication factor A C-terminal domain-containing protein n=1 Tax=Heracleum sosnowskyi TaxID=360622 RepID=A0AAD8M6Z5_9APIA|nr:hypothetical protein POM88_046488 [Heracleum sosnowskyi]